jgi:hypothetical protein
MSVSAVPVTVNEAVIPDSSEMSEIHFPDVRFESIVSMAFKSGDARTSSNTDVFVPK